MQEEMCVGEASNERGGTRGASGDVPQKTLCSGSLHPGIDPLTDYRLPVGLCGRSEQHGASRHQQVGQDFGGLQVGNWGRLFGCRGRVFFAIW